MPKYPKSLLVFALVGAAAIATLIAGCSGKPEIPTVVVEARDFAFSLPASVPGGLTLFGLKNVGKDPHHMQFLKFNDGVTQEKFQTTLQGALQAVPTEGEAALFRIFEVATLAGGPAGVGPGDRIEAVVDIPQGQYALVCFLAGADGVPHLAKGMVQPLTVTAAPAERPGAPKADVNVSLRDWAFGGAPASLKAGTTAFKVTNEGKEPHEMAVIKLKGATAEQARTFLMTPPGQAPSGPPPFEDAGGFQGIMPGQSGWVWLELERGEYAFLCFIPSPAKEFAPHLALGMFSPLKVE
jgi:uncharacterized cupredoxin-like copper-binding protein